MEKDVRYEALKQVCEEVINLKNKVKATEGKELPLPLARVQNKVRPVIGEGNHCAKIMFIGEAPGKNEAETGRPFCGRAGAILDELFKSIGMDRSQVYVTNIVKDRPPMNRDPYPDEIKLYAPFLDRQIDIIQPEVIAMLGRFSMNYIFEKFGLHDQLLSISQMHGHLFDAKASYGPIKLLALYHPAVAVYNPDTLDELKKDFNILKKFSK